ncbi:DUF4352 domain-containing protein [Enterococcus sp. HY326]|uniref:DUF4352 domain-containing protein n=1 Tax=Enterococcus sp. HY326 TaxID=2971265 RepID=UPI00223F2933|nr:DUF4352 domain-containing protein [Enterococcus sp. HY326]
MAKKIKGEDGKVYKVKKPFYKKVWFWVLIVIVVVAIGGGLGGSKGTSTNKNGGTKIESSSSVGSSESETKTVEFYNIGDTVSVGDAEYTLNSVELTDERNQFDETNPAAVVKITYTIKNNGDSDIPVGLDVEVYGPDDKKSETYPNDNTLGSVAPGKQMDCVANFGLNATGEIEIYFSPLVSFEDAAVFKASV